MECAIVDTLVYNSSDCVLIGVSKVKGSACMQELVEGLLHRGVDRGAGRGLAPLWLPNLH